MKVKIANKLRRSFTPQEELNPLIFNTNKKMESTVSGAVLLIITEFLETIKHNIKLEDIESILLTGSLANYSYNKWSDVDIHLVVDYSKFDENKKLIKDYLRTKAINWNDRHKITIHGHEVEIYFQDIKEPHHSTGIYDVTDDRWLIEPKLLNSERAIDENLPLAFKKADYISIEIDKLVEQQGESTIEKIDILKDKIKKMRQTGLEKDGEYSVENLAFKILRRRGDLKLLHQAARIIFDKTLSTPQIIDEGVEWWKKRRKLDNKNYRELLGYISKKTAFKRKYASKRTGYPKSANRRKIAKKGKPYVFKPRFKMGIGAPPGVLQEREIDPVDTSEQGKFGNLSIDGNNLKTRDRVIANVLAGETREIYVLRKERGVGVGPAKVACLKQHTYKFTKVNVKNWGMELVGSPLSAVHDDNKDSAGAVIIDPKKCLYFGGRPKTLNQVELLNILDDELGTGRVLEIKTDKGLSYHVPNYSTIIAKDILPTKEPEPKKTAPVGPSRLHQMLSAEKRGIGMSVIPKKDFWFTNWGEISIPEDILKINYVSYKAGKRYILEFDKEKASSDKEHGADAKDKFIKYIKEMLTGQQAAAMVSTAIVGKLMGKVLPKNTGWAFSKEYFLTKFDFEAGSNVCDSIDCNKSQIIFYEESNEETKKITINQYLDGVKGGLFKKEKEKEKEKKAKKTYIEPRSPKSIFIDLLSDKAGHAIYEDERANVSSPLIRFKSKRGAGGQLLDEGLLKAIRQMNPKVGQNIIKSYVKNTKQMEKVKEWYTTDPIRDKICKGLNLTPKDLKTRPDFPRSNKDIDIPIRCGVKIGIIYETIKAKDALGSVFGTGRAFKVSDDVQASLRANGLKYGIVPVPNKKNTWYMPIAHAKFWKKEWDPNKDYSESPTELIVPYGKASELSPDLLTELVLLAKLAKLVFNGPAKIYIKSGAANRGSNHPTGKAADIRISTNEGLQSAQDTYAFLIAAIKSGKVKDGGVGYYANNVGYYNKTEMDANSEYPHYDLTNKGPRKWFWFKCKKNKVASCKASVDSRFFKKQGNKSEDFQTTRVPMSAVQVASEANPLSLPADVYDKIARYSEAIANIDSGTTA